MTDTTDAQELVRHFAFTKDEREAFVSICFTAMRLNDEFRKARSHLSFEDLRNMSAALANLMLQRQSERAPRKDAAELTATKEALRESAATIARLQGEIVGLREALEPFALSGSSIFSDPSWSDFDEVSILSEDGFLLAKTFVRAFRRAALNSADCPLRERDPYRGGNP